MRTVSVVLCQGFGPYERLVPSYSDHSVSCAEGEDVFESVGKRSTLTEQIHWFWRSSVYTWADVYRCCLRVCIYQGGDAQKDDKDDECLKDSVLNDEKTSRPELIPDPPCTLGRV